MIRMDFQRLGFMYYNLSLGAACNLLRLMAYTYVVVIVIDGICQTEEQLNTGQNNYIDKSRYLTW